MQTRTSRDQDILLKLGLELVIACHRPSLRTTDSRLCIRLSACVQYQVFGPLHSQSRRFHKSPPTISNFVSLAPFLISDLGNTSRYTHHTTLGRYLHIIPALIIRQYSYTLRVYFKSPTKISSCHKEYAALPTVRTTRATWN